MHRLMQYAGWTLQLAGFGIIAYYKGANQFKGVGVGLVHMIVGGFVTLVATAQPLNACFRPHAWSADELASMKTTPTPCNDNRKCWELMHKGLGYIAAVGGLGNVALAIIMVAETHGTQDTMVVVAAGTLVISLIVIIFYSCMKAIQGGNSAASAPQKRGGEPDLQAKKACGRTTR